jgi:hypothetical protein
MNARICLFITIQAQSRNLYTSGCPGLGYRGQHRPTIDIDGFGGAHLNAQHPVLTVHRFELVAPAIADTFVVRAARGRCVRVTRPSGPVPTAIGSICEESPSEQSKQGQYYTDQRERESDEEKKQCREQAQHPRDEQDPSNDTKKAVAAPGIRNLVCVHNGTVEDVKQEPKAGRKDTCCVHSRTKTVRSRPFHMIKGPVAEIEYWPGQCQEDSGFPPQLPCLAGTIL